MGNRIEATLINGVFKPDRQPTLADQSRVRLTVEPIEIPSPAAALEAWQAIQVRLRLRPIHGGGVRFTRDELHERR